MEAGNIHLLVPELVNQKRSVLVRMIDRYAPILFTGPFACKNPLTLYNRSFREPNLNLEILYLDHFLKIRFALYSQIFSKNSYIDLNIL